MSEWNFPNGKFKDNDIHASMLSDRYLGLKKKKLTINFKNIQWKSAKMIVVFNRNISWCTKHYDDMHRNFASFDRGWIFQNRDIDSFPGNMFPFWKLVLKWVCGTDWDGGDGEGVTRVQKSISSTHLVWFCSRIIVCIGVSTPPPPKKNNTPLFLAKHPLNWQTVQDPLFRKSPPLYWFFMPPPP